MHRKKRRAVIKPGMSLSAMLKIRPWNSLIKNFHVLTLDIAMARTGFSGQHIKRLCADGKMGHFTRGPKGQYFFLPEHIDGVFKTMIPVAR